MCLYNILVHSVMVNIMTFLSFSLVNLAKDIVDLLTKFFFTGYTS
jgi:hypothetical protein